MSWNFIVALIWFLHHCPLSSSSISSSTSNLVGHRPPSSVGFPPSVHFPLAHFGKGNCSFFFFLSKPFFFNKMQKKVSFCKYPLSLYIRFLLYIIILFKDWIFKAFAFKHLFIHCSRTKRTLKNHYILLKNWMFKIIILFKDLTFKIILLFEDCIFKNILKIYSVG